MEIFNSLFRKSVGTSFFDRHMRSSSSSLLLPSSSSSVGSAGAIKTKTAKSVNKVVTMSKESGCGGRSPSPFYLSDLPDLPLDKVISFLEDDDLRRFHQVARSWKVALERRTRDEHRRQELVRRIRANKENIRNGSTISVTQEPVPIAIPQRAIRERSSLDVADGKKTCNSFILMECTNQVVESNTPTSVNITPIVSTPADAANFLTPMSPFEFQDFEKAERSLEPGQKLLQCRRCRGPVPSPATPMMDSHELQESRRLSSQSTRCKLISRLDDFHHHNPLLDSPQKRECKKAKTLSTADLSPIPYAPPVTVASLGEQMSQSLALSSPCLTASSNFYTTSLPPPSPIEFDTVKRSTSCSSITGIDLPHHETGNVESPVELSGNMSCLDNSPFFYSYHHPSHHLHQFGTFSVDLNGSGLNCSRSCCSPRRVHNNSQLHTSHFSDSGLSFEVDSIDDFSNVIFSPEVPASVTTSLARDSNHRRSARNSIERGRDVSHFSDGALSLSSYSHLQRSDHSLNFGSFENNNESAFPNVLECPNPKCGYRFCSNCEESEHSGRPCHVLSSDQFESYSFESNNNNSFSLGGMLDVNRTNSNSLSRDNISFNGNNKSSSSKKSSNSSKSKHKNPKKIPLRRLARL